MEGGEDDVFEHFADQEWMMEAVNAAENGGEFEKRLWEDSESSPILEEGGQHGRSTLANVTNRPFIPQEYWASMGFTRSKPERVNEDFDTHREGNKNGQNRNDSHQPATEPTEDSVSAHTLDEEAATIWIYPTNAGSIREYQLKIVEKALFTNTLVALPTGLGKTFIAAVVMYNFYRWFPTSKAIFMAPTRPLVAQQIEACFRITGISQKETVEMTGTMPPEIRRLHWMSNFRVYFLTPQTLLNDLQTGLCPKDDICLLVVDEAHRSTGNHAYAEVIRALPSQHFRVLALTATPGSDTNAVQEVVKNLRISGIELRTEESPDIQPYTHERKLDIKIITPSKEISAIKDVFVKVVGTFLDRLCAERVYYDRDPMNASRYQLMLARTKFREQLQQNGRNGTFTQDKVSLIEGNFAVAMSLVGALTLLMQHGIQNFYSSLTSFIDETKDQWRCKQKFELTRNESFNLMMQNISQMLKQPNFIGHPKLTSTVEIIVEHFRNHEQSMSSKQNVESNDQAHDMYDTRAIIFSSFRESVEEITALLQKQSPLVRAMSFIGQASGKRGTKGLKQQEQLDLITKFQNGKYNVLVCTSIGEEGLDIGNVDLIVCFDAQNSPIRMLQRMGRTGRKREGKVVLLLSAGREEDCYKKANASYKLVQRLMQDSKRRLDLYPAHLARMLPPNVKPQKVEMALDLSSHFDAQKKISGRAKKRTSDNFEAERTNDILSEQQREDLKLHHFPALLAAIQARELSARTNISGDTCCSVKTVFGEDSGLIFRPDPSRYPLWQHSLLPTSLFGHSKRTNRFVKCMKSLEESTTDRSLKQHIIEAKIKAAKFLFEESDQRGEPGPEINLQKRKKLTSKRSAYEPSTDVRDRNSRKRQTKARASLELILGDSDSSNESPSMKRQKRARKHSATGLNRRTSPTMESEGDDLLELDINEFITATSSHTTCRQIGRQLAEGSPGLNDTGISRTLLPEKGVTKVTKIVKSAKPTRKKAKLMINSSQSSSRSLDFCVRADRFAVDTLNTESNVHIEEEVNAPQKRSWGVLSLCSCDPSVHSSEDDVIRPISIPTDAMRKKGTETIDRDSETPVTLKGTATVPQSRASPPRNLFAVNDFFADMEDLEFGQELENMVKYMEGWLAPAREFIDVVYQDWLKMGRSTASTFLQSRNGGNVDLWFQRQLDAKERIDHLRIEADRRCYALLKQSTEANEKVTSRFVLVHASSPHNERVSVSPRSACISSDPHFTQEELDKMVFSIPAVADSRVVQSPSVAHNASGETQSPVVFVNKTRSKRAARVVSSEGDVETAQHKITDEFYEYEEFDLDGNELQEILENAENSVNNNNANTGPTPLVERIRRRRQRGPRRPPRPRGTPANPQQNSRTVQMRPGTKDTPCIVRSRRRRPARLKPDHPYLEVEAQVSDDSSAEQGGEFDPENDYFVGLDCDLSGFVVGDEFVDEAQLLNTEAGDGEGHRDMEGFYLRSLLDSDRPNPRFRLANNVHNRKMVPVYDDEESEYQEPNSLGSFIVNDESGMNYTEAEPTQFISNPPSEVDPADYQADRDHSEEMNEGVW